MSGFLCSQAPVALQEDGCITILASKLSLKMDY